MAPKVVHELSFSTYESTLSSSNRFDNSTKQNHERIILITFPKVKIHIPLMEDIKKVPWYEEYLKKNFIAKDKLKDRKEIGVGSEYLYMLQRRLIPRCQEALNGYLA